MNTSSLGVQFIKEFESLRLTAYVCPAGYLTVGYGHKGNDVKKGMRISEQEALDLLVNDLKEAERWVNKYKKYNWSQNEYDAMVSFAFNLGKNTDTLVANGTRSKEEIATKIPLYCNAGGSPCEGLRKRRLKEYFLFTKGVYDGRAISDSEWNATSLKYYSKIVKRI